MSKDRSQFFVLTAVALLLMLAAIDQTIVTTALPTIVTDLGSLDQLSWIVTAYLLTSTVSAPIYGKLGDIYGRRIMMEIAIIIFLVSSLLAAIAQTMWWMIFARALQGLGGGGLFVLAFTLVGDIIPARERGKVQGLFAGVFGFSSVVGPLAGGFFVDQFTWHWIFLINLPIGLCSLLIIRLKFDLKTTAISKRIDFTGAILLTTVLSSLIIITSLSGEKFNIKSNLITILLFMILTGTFLFVYNELRAINPILPMSLFRMNNFRIYSIMGLISSCILFSILTFIPVFLQLVKGVSPSWSGLLIIPLTIGIIIGSLFSGKIMTKTGKYKRLPSLGAVILALGLALISKVHWTTPNTTISIYLLIAGCGLGPQLSVITTAIQNSAPKNQMGVATAGITLFRQIGSSVGVAALGSVFVSTIRAEVRENSSLNHNIFDPLNLTREEILNLSIEQRLLLQESFSMALETVFIILMVLSVILFLISLIPEEKVLETELK